MLLFMAAFATYLRMELPGVYGDNGMLALFALLTAGRAGRRPRRWSARSACR